MAKRAFFEMTAADERHNWRPQVGKTPILIWRTADRADHGVECTSVWRQHGRGTYFCFDPYWV